eukprot:CAMPEP_0116042914 /NCGR_PEP_ID=MMETSP0321-20121206/26010_1 /TAXON_ID=163516 /ORGANISM="Leptocylindrus danicus var. danicus, Strain B650" /LENGTH=43 /DNA_ID= /DNA_START= /DNA_END= /DNA_ORIENTATION=
MMEELFDGSNSHNNDFVRMNQMEMESNDASSSSSAAMTSTSTT